MSEEMMQILKRLVGRFCDGTNTSIKIYPDDATRTVHIIAGTKSWWGDSLEDAIDKAIASNKGDLDE